jgi:hypothetical protein
MALVAYYAFIFEELPDTGTKVLVIIGALVCTLVAVANFLNKGR